MNKSVGIILFGILIGIGAFVFATRDTTPQSLNADLYPLYAGVVWGPVQTSTVEGAVGYEVVSEPILNITNIAASSTPFYEYYQHKLTAAGWTQDMSREAGGPGAEVSVFTKGTEFIVVSFRSDFKVKPKDAPMRCPCDLTFTLVSGGVK